MNDRVKQLAKELSDSELRRLLQIRYGTKRRLLEQTKGLFAKSNEWGKPMKESKVKPVRTRRGATYWADDNAILLACVLCGMWQDEYGLELDEGAARKKIVRLLWLESEDNRLGLSKSNEKTIDTVVKRLNAKYPLGSGYLLELRRPPGSKNKADLMMVLGERRMMIGMLSNFHKRRPDLGLLPESPPIKPLQPEYSLSPEKLPK